MMEETRAIGEETLVSLNDVRERKSLVAKNSGDVKLAASGLGHSYRIQGIGEDGTKKISLWHDVSLVHQDPVTRAPTEYRNFVCEIPKFSRKKYEIATNEEGNPIKQDERKGQLREFLKGDIYFNYGCFPQTWEDPTFFHPDAEGTRGDNDPLDVVEIGARIIKPGGICPVKVLGILCMIDEGETDWKVICINSEDKWAPFLNDIDDVEMEMPGMLDAVREWYRTYKLSEGKPLNTFALGERFMDRAYAMNIIEETHHAWEMLISGEKDREVEASGDSIIVDLVRNLSKNSLFTLGADLDVHPEAHSKYFDNEEIDDADGTIFF
ncbi:hypothetical protein MPSEU_000522600 [Mayamaea pseudoterrestris]|nr:hypothetical protein MPSEU_000522600 [Mayamaea pseudoterrestris]